MYHILSRKLVKFAKSSLGHMVIQTRDIIMNNIKE